MMEKIRIVCPDSHISKEERIKLIINEFEKWISDDLFVTLVKAFGGNMDINLSTTEKIKWLKEEFVGLWDFRKRQKEALTKEGEAARWLLKNSQQALENKELIYKTSERLGLIGIDNTIFDKPDYYLPLGGARMSNLRRCQIANDNMECKEGTAVVVALSGMRPIAESERVGYIDTYAPEALTEFDAIVEGMKLTFSTLEEIDEMAVNDNNPNLSYVIKQFSRLGAGGEYYAVAAPSTDPLRRANSADCFKFFFEKFKVPEHSKLVNCTSQIYCSYQQVRSLFFAIDYNVEFDTIGFPYALNSAVVEKNNGQLYEPVNYLQEMKGTIDAMYDFVLRYSFLLNV